VPVGTIADPSIFGGYSAGDPVQSNRLRAAVKVVVAGVDVTARLEPHLIKVRCLVGARLEEYQLELELDDRDGSLPIPPVDSPVKCYFGWIGEGSMILVWDGVVHDIEYGFDRKSGGRKMWIHGFGGSFLDRGKEPATFHTGAGADSDSTEQGPPISITEPLNTAAKYAEQTITVHPKVAAFNLDRYDQANESYYHWGKTWVEKAGGLFRVTGGTHGEAMWQGEDASGNQLPIVNAVWGKNLIAFRIRPMAARPMWAKSRSAFFDIQNSQWKLTEKGTQGMQSGLATAGFSLPNPAPNQNASQQDTSGANDGTLQYQGPGKIVMNGEPTATGNGYVNLVGVRPGVDGRYWIETAEHEYSRNGYITWCDVFADTVSGGGVGGTGSLIGANYLLSPQPPKPLFSH
jgi:hypothetical protein